MKFDDLKLPEKALILLIGDIGEPISPYDLDAKSDLSYPSIYNYCRKLSFEGILSIEVVEGSKKSKKNNYSLTLTGMAFYVKIKRAKETISPHSYIPHILKHNYTVSPHLEIVKNAIDRYLPDIKNKDDFVGIFYFAIQNALLHSLKELETDVFEKNIINPSVFGQLLLYKILGNSLFAYGKDDQKVIQESILDIINRYEHLTDSWTFILMEFDHCLDKTLNRLVKFSPIFGEDYIISKLLIMFPDIKDRKIEIGKREKIEK